MPVYARFYQVSSIKYQVQITQQITCPIIYGRATNDQSYAKFNSSNSHPNYHIQGNKNTYQSYADNGSLLYLTDDTTSNMTAWIPGKIPWLS